MAPKVKIDPELLSTALCWLKIGAITICAGVLFTAYFAIPSNCDGFWSFVGTATRTVSGFVIEQMHRGQPTRVATAPNSQETTSPSANDQEPVPSSESDPLSDAPMEAFMPPGIQPVLPPPISHEHQVTGEAIKVKPKKNRPKHGKPVRFEKTKIAGIPLYKTVIDLNDPETFVTVGLANNAKEANSNYVTHGDETFDSFVKRYHHFAMLANGTFFSKDDEKRVMGNLVSDGEFRKYSQWENYGTTLGLRADNEPEMITARMEGQPPWQEYWFSITCGPRLLQNGEVSIHAAEEGFRDSHVLTIGPRSALGFNRKKKLLIHATFLYGLSLAQEAKLMKELGCDEAMNLDGGASRALAHDGSVVMPAQRPLTNVLVVYDTKNPAPPNIVASWERFQEGERPTPHGH